MKGGKQSGAQTVNQRQQALKERRKALGLVRLELWIKPEHRDVVRNFAKKLDK